MSCCFLAAAAAPAQQLARDFLDNKVIHDIYIDLDPNDWDTLKQNYLEDTYYHANVTAGPLTASSVGIRSRGRGSRSPYKPNLDVNVDKYIKNQTFADLSFFILKANNQDPSMLHEPLAFELYHKMGLPAPREAFARLFINGQYFGFYTIVEHEDEDFLDRNLGEHQGDLFEWKPNAVYNFEYLGEDPAPYANLLDPKTNTNNPDYSKFIDMVKAINFSSDADFVSAVSRYLDLKLYLTLVATENAIAEIDGLWDSVYGTNNIYIYRFAGQDLFQIIPWDKDLTFWQIGRPLPEPANNPLARRLLAIPEYHTFYLSQLAKAADLMGGEGGWADQEVSRMYALIREPALDDPHKQCQYLGSPNPPEPCGPADFQQGVTDMHSFIATRATFIRQTLMQEGYKAPAGGPEITLVGNRNDVAPGAIVTIMGANFGGDAMARSLPLPRSSGRSFIAVDGVRAPLISFSSSQAVVQIPWDIPTGTFPIAVSANGALSNTVETAVSRAAPNIFAVVHSDGSSIDVSHPARAGEIVTAYSTGLGPVDFPMTNGNPPPASVLVHTLDALVATVGQESAEILFSGLNPGLVGLYQVNIALPADVASGTQTLTISADGNAASAQIQIQ